MEDNIVRDAEGKVVVPMGTQKTMSEKPKDTLPHPAPQNQMPPSPEVKQEPTKSNAIESMTTFDELSAKKGFKDPEDLAKAYKNLESQNSRVEAMLAEAIRDQQSGIKPESAEPVIPEDSETQDALKIVDSRISKKVDDLANKLEFKLHLIEHPEDRPFTEDALKYVKDNPGIKWSLAFKAAKADNIATLAREEGRQESRQLSETKENAQSVHSSQRTAENLPIKDIIEGIKTGKIPLSEAKKFINSIQ